METGAVVEHFPLQISSKTIHWMLELVWSVSLSNPSRKAQFETDAGDDLSKVTGDLDARCQRLASNQIHPNCEKCEHAQRSRFPLHNSWSKQAYSTLGDSGLITHCQLALTTNPERNV